MDVRKKIQNHGQLRKTRGKMINSYHFFFFFCNDKKKQHSKQEKKEATETGNNGNE